MNGRDAGGRARASSRRSPRFGAPGALAALVLIAALGAAAWIGVKPPPPSPRVVLAFNPMVEARLDTATAPTAPPEAPPGTTATTSEPSGEGATPAGDATVASTPDAAEVSLTDATLAETGLASAVSEPTVERTGIETEPAPILPAEPEPATARTPLAGEATASAAGAPEPPAPEPTVTARIPPPPAVDAETGGVFARAPEPLPEPASGIADAAAPAEPAIEPGAAPEPVVATAPAAALPLAPDTPTPLARIEPETQPLPAPAGTSGEPAPAPEPATAEAPAAASETAALAPPPTPAPVERVIETAARTVEKSAPKPEPKPEIAPARVEAPANAAVETEAPPTPRPMPTAVAASRIPATDETADEAATPEPDAPAGLALLPEAAVGTKAAPEPILVPEVAATPPEPTPTPASTPTGDARTGDARTGDARTGDARTQAPPPPAAPTTKPAAPQQLAFAKPFAQPTPKKTRPVIAVVLMRIGLGPAATAAALRLPGAVTLAFASYARNLQAQIDRARAGGHEVLLDLPMEPMRYPAIDPGPRPLLVSLSSVQILDRLDWHLGRATGYTGVTNDMGSRFTSSRDALRPVLAAIKARGLYFLDSRTSSRSQGVKLASSMGLRFAANDRFLDVQASRAAIDRRLAQIERIARRRGFAVAVGHPFPVTLDRIAAWLPTLEKKGLTLVPLGEVVARRGAK